MLDTIVQKSYLQFKLQPLEIWNGSSCLITYMYISQILSLDMTIGMAILEIWNRSSCMISHAINLIWKAYFASLAKRRKISISIIWIHTSQLSLVIKQSLFKSQINKNRTEVNYTLENLERAMSLPSLSLTYGWIQSSGVQETLQYELASLNSTSSYLPNKTFFTNTFPDLCSSYLQTFPLCSRQHFSDSVMSSFKVIGLETTHPWKPLVHKCKLLISLIQWAIGGYK